MRRGLLFVVLLFAVCCGSALAGPVSRPVARRAIDRWWADPTKPGIEWCARKHYGTICGLYVPIRADEVKGHESVIAWVSRTRGRVRVANIGAYVVVNITPVFFRPPS